MCYKRSAGSLLTTLSDELAATNPKATTAMPTTVPARKPETAMVTMMASTAPYSAAESSCRGRCAALESR